MRDPRRFLTDPFRFRRCPGTHNGRRCRRYRRSRRDVLDDLHGTVRGPLSRW
ncbi:hypothetical protein ACFPM0_13805 [Pseudonocardia sulfidoxydans]|uniref:hypothetical protein n=1 Tax=Pseudonocardia sulfidoxydans TaxID=54011 RepID=UPI0036171737